MISHDLKQEKGNDTSPVFETMEKNYTILCLLIMENSPISCNLGLHVRNDWIGKRHALKQLVISYQGMAQMQFLCGDS